MSLHILQQIWINIFLFPMHSSVLIWRVLTKLQHIRITVILITWMCQSRSWYPWFLNMITSNSTLQTDNESSQTNTQQGIHPLKRNDGLKTIIMVNFNQPLHAEKVIKKALKHITNARKNRDFHDKSVWSNWNSWCTQRKTDPLSALQNLFTNFQDVF